VAKRKIRSDKGKHRIPVGERTASIEAVMRDPIDASKLAYALILRAREMQAEKQTQADEPPKPQSQ
jgi:hypothetical protein